MRSHRRVEVSRLQGVKEILRERGGKLKRMSPVDANESSGSHGVIVLCWAHFVLKRELAKAST